MNREEFLALYDLNFYTNSFLVLIVLALYLHLFRKSFSSLIDPLFLGVLAQAFSAAVVFILYFSKNIDSYFFYSFISTEIAFLVGCFALFRPPALSKVDVSLFADRREEFRIFCVVFYGFFLLFSALYLKSAGFVLFRSESRLLIMQDLGVVSWFIDILWAAAPLLFFLKRYVFNLRSFADYIVLGLSMVFLLTKGGKSDFLPFIFSVFLASYIFSIAPLKRTLNFLIILTPVLLILATTITLAIWNVNANVVSFVFERFILFGDVFFQGYNQTFFDSLPDSGFFPYFFSSIYAFLCHALGFVPEPKVIMGYEMSKFYYGIEEGMGPNARHNILGLYLFGPYVAVVFSFLVGLLLAVLRRGLWLEKGWIFIFLYAVVSIFAYVLMIDPSLAVGYFIKIVVVMGSMILVSLLIFSMLRKGYEQ
jgi:hypothetical protein